MKEKVILAYSGGLDTTAIIPWLKETYGYDVVCVCADCGQEERAWTDLSERANSCGAAKLYIEDITDEFCDNYIVPCVQAHAVYENKYLTWYFNGTTCSLLRDLLRLHVRKVLLLSATVLPVRVMTRSVLSLLSRLLAPDIKIIAPWRDD